MSRTYTIQEISESTSLTIRTLHYYDEINLLKPSRSKNRYRVYLEKDLTRLQQIITLKYVGFSLANIKKVLDNPDLNLLTLLKIQNDALDEEAQRIQKLKHLINYLINQHEHKNSNNWDVIVKIIEIIELKKDVQAQWYKVLMTKNELNIFSKVTKQRTKKWLMLFEEIKNNLHLNPKSKSAKKIANKWHALADEAYGDCPELKRKLWEAYKSGVIPDLSYDEKIIEFLMQVSPLF